MDNEQSTPKIEYRVPISGSGRTIRKSASHEPLTQRLASSEDENPGGVRLSTLSLSPEKEIHRIDLHIGSGTHGMDPILKPADFAPISADQDDVFVDEHTLSRVPYNRITPQPKIGKNGETLMVDNAVQIDAQGIYPSTACIFVANLAQSYDDDTLELEVTKHFSKFGSVFVKIRRDSNHMPFAFCQFTSDEDARSAERNGKGIVILGRPCRTEMAKANVTFMVTKKIGSPIRPHEALQLLQPLGEIAQVKYLDRAVQESLNFPPTVLVSYKMYDARRDVIKNFAKHRIYRVMPFDPRSMSPEKNQSQREESRKLLSQYDKDRRSVFIGNLKPGTTDDEVIALAKMCGRVVSAQVFNKPVSGLNGPVNCFAFVEFVRPDSADRMIQAYHEEKMNGYVIRVERKQSRSFETPRRVVSAQRSPYSDSVFARHLAMPNPGLGADNLASPLGRHTWTRSRTPSRPLGAIENHERTYENASPPIRASNPPQEDRDIVVTERFTLRDQQTPVHSTMLPNFGTYHQPYFPVYPGYYPLMAPVPMLEQHNKLSQMTPQPSPGKVCHEGLAQTMGWNHYHNEASDCFVQPAPVTDAPNPSTTPGNDST